MSSSQGIALPLSAAQREIWFAEQQLNTAHPVYNLGEYIEIDGPVDPVLFETALRRVVGEADALHVRFVEGSDGPRQVLGPLSDWLMPAVDVSEEPDPSAAAQAWITADVARPMDLTRGPLFSYALIKLEPDRFFWYQGYHHIVMDRFGFSLVARRVAEIYTALAQVLACDQNGLGSLRQLLDSNSAYRASEQFAQDQEYWIKRFADRPEPTRLAGRSSGTPTSFVHRTAVSSLARVDRLQVAARRAGVGWSRIVIATTAVYLHRLTGAQDVILGLPVTARQDPVLKRVPGMVSNLLPLRLSVRPDMSLSELIGQVAEEVREVLAHQRYRGEDLHRDLGLPGHIGTSFAAAINIMSFDEDLRFAGYRTAANNVSSGLVGDVSILVWDRRDGSGLRIGLQAHPEVCSADDLAAHHQRFLTLLETIAVADPDRPISRIDLLSTEERHQLLVDYNNTAHPVVQASLPVLFQTQVQATPDAVAVVFENTTLTYAQLNARANRLAHALIARGVGPEQIVALALPRSANMIVAILAVLKTGAAYLPLDPDYPPARIGFMLGDARPVLLLTDTQTENGLPDSGLTVRLVVDHPDTTGMLDGCADTDPTDAERTAPLAPQHPAYVIYTSGSTGQPKGVVICHAGISSLAAAQIERFGIDADSRVLQFSSPSFDASVMELLMAFAAGAALVVPSAGPLAGEALVSVVANQGVSHALIPPTALASAPLVALPGFKTLVVGGEACPADLVATWSMDRRMINAYGPTETTVCATMSHPLSDAADRAAPIGRPIVNTRVYVLDAGLQLVSPGVAGELYVAGAGLARGYLHRSGLTAQRFVADPYGPAGARMYRTGDRVRWRADGDLEFIGRADDQVKVRGFRIEPGEIEIVLAAHPDVAQTAVIARQGRPGDKRLVAYVVPTADNAFQPDLLRDYLRQRLPDYMVPAALVMLDRLPLTPNGKLDRYALPAPELSSAGTGRAPRTPQEQLLAELFAEVLGLAQVGIDDDFFDLGGHSLLATRLVARVRATLGVELELRVLFETPTVAGLTAHLDDAQQARLALRPYERPDVVPLSFAQRRLWFLHQMEGPSATYNIPLALRLSGDLDRQALQAALGDVIARHESLRTIFPQVEGTPYQRILDVETACPPLPLTQTTLVGLPETLATAARYGFDLVTEPPLRAELFVLGPNEHVLLLVVHHIAGDGWSLAPLSRDLAAAYTARCRGEAPVWSPLPVQYADYTLWQHQLLGDEADPDSLFARQVAYWTQTLAGLPEQLELPADRPRPAVASYRGDYLTVRLEPTLHRGLRELARQGGASLFMVLQAGLAALLSRLGAGSDIPLSSPIAGRTDQALDDLVGFFVNTLVLRTDTSGDPTFRQLLARVRETALAAYAHQDVSFEYLVEVLNPTRSLAHHPLFQVMLALQNAPPGGFELPGLGVSVVPVPIGIAKFDLFFGLCERRGPDGAPQGLDGAVEYASDLFDAATVEALFARWVRLLETAVADPDRPINRIDILTAEERARLLIDYDDTAAPIPAASLPALFEAQVQATPEAPAVVFEDTALTYAQLNAEANRLARVLVGRGVGPEQIVALALPRSPELVVAILAVFKAGAGYLPVDLDYPATRIAFMLHDARPVLLVTTTQIKAGLPDTELTARLVIDDPDTTELLAGCADTDPTDADRTAHLTPQHPAYVIYTSGSTGTPKGVLIAHQNVVRLFGATQHWFGFGADDVWTLFHSYAFDFSVWEIWGPLLHGGRLIVVPYEVSRSPQQFLRLLAREGVTVLNQTPSAFYQLMQADQDNPAVGQSLALRTVVFGGEALDLARLGDWYERHPDQAPTLVNMYGITETTVHVTHVALDRYRAAAGATSIIGTGLPDLCTYVLDASLGLVPPGVTGELYIAGAGLARGYLGRPGLTSERFVADPYGPPGTRMYRTGDRVRWRTDGDLEFIGRVDDQVKLRGFRIEPGEIETVLAQHPDVAQAAVIARQDRPDDKRLVAYVVPSVGSAARPDLLREYLHARLPEYMVPAAVVMLDRLPLTPNGKLDRKALPAPEFGSAGTGRAPRTPQEQLLCELFAEVLGLARVSIDDDFFDLGGHSLLATRLVARVRATLGVELGLRALFEAPTPAGLAARLHVDDPRDAFDVILPLRTQGRHSPLFCIHPGGGISWSYCGLIKHLGPDHPIYGVQARSLARPEPRPTSIEQMAADYADQIRRVHPAGPYCLLGWSVGGIVAHAVATEPQQRGQQVALLAILDAYPACGLLSHEDVPALDERDMLVAMLDYDAKSLEGEPLTFAKAVEILRSQGSALANLEEYHISAVIKILANNSHIAIDFTPDRFHGDLLLFTSTMDQPEDTPTPDAWKSYIDGKIETHDITSKHDRMTQPGPLAQIGPILAAKLQEITSNASPSHLER